jgi:hypothetical protein
MKFYFKAGQWPNASPDHHQATIIFIIAKNFLCISIGFPRAGFYSSTTEPATPLYSPNQSIHFIHEFKHPILLIKVPAAVWPTIIKLRTGTHSIFK